MRTITPKKNRTVCVLAPIFLFLTSLIGCASLLPDPVIDQVPPGTPKGFVEFYTFLGDHLAEQEGKYCYSLPKAGPEYSNLYLAFAVRESSGTRKFVLVQDPRYFRPESFPLEFDLPSLWRRIAMAPGEYNFTVYAGRIVLLELGFPTSVTVKVTEGMITPVRVEAKCFSEKKLGLVI